MTDMAFAAALMAARPSLVGFGMRLCFDRERAEDLASETVTKAWRARASFDPGTNLRAWLSAILRNQFLTEQRRKKWDGGYIEDLGPINVVAPGSPEDYVHLLDLEEALDLIEPDQRAAVIEVALGAEYEEAAETLGCAVGTIKSRVGRGRKALRELSQ